MVRETLESPPISPSQETEEAADINHFRREVEVLIAQNPQDNHLKAVKPQELSWAEMDMYYNFKDVVQAGFSAEAVKRFETKLRSIQDREERLERPVLESRKNFLAYLRTIVTENAGVLRRQEREAIKEEKV